MVKKGFKAKDSLAADKESRTYTVKGTWGDKSSRAKSRVAHNMSSIETLLFEVDAPSSAIARSGNK
jgi:hypothetical protein